MRFIIFLLGVLISTVPASGQSLYFISLAWIKPDGQAHYDRFLQQVTPIWNRHGMRVIARGRVLDQISQDASTVTPSEIAVLRIDDAADFDAYIADPDYQAIRRLRQDAVERMLVLEGTRGDDQQPPNLNAVPLFALWLARKNLTAPEPPVRLNIRLAAAIKGQVPAFFTGFSQASLLPMSFDDNPMGFLEAQGSEDVTFILEQLN